MEIMTLQTNAAGEIYKIIKDYDVCLIIAYYFISLRRKESFHHAMLYNLERLITLSTTNNNNRYVRSSDIMKNKLTRDGFPISTIQMCTTKIQNIYHKSIPKENHEIIDFYSPKRDIESPIINYYSKQEYMYSSPQNISSDNNHTISLYYNNMISFHGLKRENIRNHGKTFPKYLKFLTSPSLKDKLKIIKKLTPETIQYYLSLHS